MNAHDAMRDNVAVYALGALSADEVAEVRAHLATCNECATEYEHLRRVVGVLALAADEAAPSPALKRRVMDAIRPEARPRIGWAVYASLSVSLAAAAAFAGLYVGAIDRLGTAQSGLQRAITAIGTLSAPSAQRYQVESGEVVRRGSDLYIVLHDVPVTSIGRVYQAWTLARNSKTMRPSVTFEPRGGVVFVRLPLDSRNVVAVAVSVEPAGGSLQPTTKPLFVVRLT